MGRRVVENTLGRSSKPDDGEHASMHARRWSLIGRVQGVGFRPFVYRLALRFDTRGWVCNQGGRLELHVEGLPRDLELFKAAIGLGLPAGAVIVGFDDVKTTFTGFSEFVIRPSADTRSSDCFPPSDVCICDECLIEMRDPLSRRFRYPFITCAQCGPRYSLLRSMPYDRCNTTMSNFSMCVDCVAEYSNPSDRRHHAQPLACAACGPWLSWKEKTSSLEGNEVCLVAAVTALRGGLIIAVRGIGGYHLLCSASSCAAIAELRHRKDRPAKPFAVLVPLEGPSGLDFARRIASLSPEEEAALLHPDRPIVIVQKIGNAHISDQVAPDLNELGIMFPYSPLLHLLLDELKEPLVATSGNVSGEPLLVAPLEAEALLGDIASGFLHHNRDIARAADDSVVRRVAARVRPIRFGRGCSPQELRLHRPATSPTIALGALQKNTVALAWGDRVAISQHIGDYTSVGGLDRLAIVLADMESLYQVSAERIVLDAHPAMHLRHFARHRDWSVSRIWHHFAHASAVAGEYPDESDMLCFTWDANGLGPDGLLWGGEALLGGPGRWARVASFRPFPLLGGSAAALQPWRSALGLCWDARLAWSKEAEFATPALRAAYQQQINCPMTSAVGRLFDAAAALLGICSVATFSAQAAMQLETICSPRLDLASAISLPLTRDADCMLRTDWQPLLEILLDDARSVPARSQVFHASLAMALRDQARSVRHATGVSTVGLTGGVFQNRLLTGLVERTLIQDGFQVRIPSLMAVNDASISFGQIIETTAGVNLPLGQAPSAAPAFA